MIFFVLYSGIILLYLVTGLRPFDRRYFQLESLNRTTESGKQKSEIQKQVDKRVAISFFNIASRVP